MDFKPQITLSSCAFGIAPGNENKIPQSIEMAQNAGFEAFEIAYIVNGEPEALSRAMKKSGAKICAVHGILNPNAGAQDKDLRRKALDIAIKYIETFADFAPCPLVEHYWNRYNNPDYGKYFFDTVGELLDAAEKYGFLFCMENAPYKPEVNERYPYTKEVAEFAAAYGEDRMFMTFDVNHGNLNEDILQAVRDCDGLIRHIHISDNHGQREEHLLPGEGIIDLRAVIAEIYQTGYTGPCNFEFCFPKNHIPQQEDFKQVFNYIKGNLL